MDYKREQQQLLGTIKKSGNSQKGTIKTFKSNPMGGAAIPNYTIVNYFAQVAYDGKDFADPTLANGLFKVILPAINEDGLVDFHITKLPTDKSAKFVYPDGREVGIIRTKITAVDGVTPLLIRLYLGG
jgi:hypothetical protein